MEQEYRSRSILQSLIYRFMVPKSSPLSIPSSLIHCSPDSRLLTLSGFTFFPPLFKSLPYQKWPHLSFQLTPWHGVPPLLSTCYSLFILQGLLLQSFPKSETIANFLELIWYVILSLSLNAILGSGSKALCFCLSCRPDCRV